MFWIACVTSTPSQVTFASEMIRAPAGSGGGTGPTRFGCPALRPQPVHPGTLPLTTGRLVVVIASLFAIGSTSTVRVLAHAEHALKETTFAVGRANTASGACVAEVADVACETMTSAERQPSINAYSRELSDEEIAAGAHRELVGGLWDEIGPLQFYFLRSEGLRPGAHAGRRRMRRAPRRRPLRGLPGRGELLRHRPQPLARRRRQARARPVAHHPPEAPPARQ